MTDVIDLMRTPDAVPATPGTTYAAGTEGLRAELKEWHANSFGIDWTEGGRTTHELDMCIKGALGDPYVRPRVDGDAIYGKTVPPSVHLMVLMDFPNFYSGGPEDDRFFEHYVYTRLAVAEVLAYDGKTATVRTTDGFVFPDVLVVFPTDDDRVFETKK